MEELLLVQVKELNDITYMRLEAFGEVKVISKTMSIYGIRTEIQYLELIRKIHGVIGIERDCKGTLCK